MLQATKNKYTVETLKPLNILYDHKHWLTQQDVDMANGYVELIERTRTGNITATPSSRNAKIRTD